MKLTKSTFAGYLVAVLIFLVTGEIIVRLISKSVILPPYNTASKDDKIGWAAKKNYTWEGEFVNSDRSTYPVSIAFDSLGFRFRDDEPADSLPTIFFIGDSFTHAVEVSTDKTYFYLLKNLLPANVAAYGLGAYGSLQQSMILDRFISVVDPDIVVLQMCSNDLIDNHIELEMATQYYVGLERPYLDLNGDIKVMVPKSKFNQFIDHSAFIRFVKMKVKSTKWWKNQLQKSRGEEKIAELHLDYPPYREALDITGKILQKFQETCGTKRQLFIFSADRYNPQFGDMKKLADSLDIPFLEKPAKAIVDALNDKQIVRTHDRYHWNEHGHRLVAEALYSDLKAFLEFEK